MQSKKKQILLVEPVAKTPYPPIGLMKIGNMLKNTIKHLQLFHTTGNRIISNLSNPKDIYITSLFTWDLPNVVSSINYYADLFPNTNIHVGGISATLLPDFIIDKTGFIPHKGLLQQAEEYPPDYSLSFGRNINSSITFASRGCIRKCPFCFVKEHEPNFYTRDDWEKDINIEFPRIVFWDNNWLASPNVMSDCDKIRRIGKTVDFNQGLDARLYDNDIAKLLSSIKIDPIRFAFDDSRYETQLLNAIKYAKKYTTSEIRVYVLYNFNDTPEDFYNRINILNKNHVLSFPMEYRKMTPTPKRFPGKHWNASLLRALKLSLLFYYRKGMITESRKSFLSIYGKTSKEFISKLYNIYEYDKTLKR